MQKCDVLQYFYVAFWTVSFLLHRLHWKSRWLARNYVFISKVLKYKLMRLWHFPSWLWHPWCLAWVDLDRCHCQGRRPWYGPWTMKRTINSLILILFFYEIMNFHAWPLAGLFLTCVLHSLHKKDLYWNFVPILKDI